MNPTVPARGLAALAVVAALAAATPALAALGERAASVDADRAALGATRRTFAVRQAFQVERLVTPANTVREYVTPSGVVFAVTWQGVSRPDLGVVLGAYAGPYVAEIDARGPSRGRRARRVEVQGAIVETWGHMRALHGRAWVPALLPAGVSVDELR